MSLASVTIMVKKYDDREDGSGRRNAVADNARFIARLRAVYPGLVPQ